MDVHAIGNLSGGLPSTDLVPIVSTGEETRRASKAFVLGKRLEPHIYAKGQGRASITKCAMPRRLNEPEEEIACEESRMSSSVF
jgi:hypothetical protein